jgi:hypothetical protein
VPMFPSRSPLAPLLLPPFLPIFFACCVMKHYFAVAGRE